MSQQEMERKGPREMQPTGQTRPAAVYTPDVDILERAEELIVRADLPGTSAESIDIRFEGGELTINGQVEERQPASRRCLYREYGVGHFHRVFAVSEAVDTSRMSAEYKDGVLTLRLPKVEAVKPRTIKVQAG
jgi:HSP20 family protein